MEDTRKKPLKGECAGCSFEYTLSAKGMIRKHLSRTGPGECSGSRKEPRGAYTFEDLGTCACGGGVEGCPNCDTEPGQVPETVTERVACDHPYPGPEDITCARWTGHEGMHMDGATEDRTQVAWLRSQPEPPEITTRAEFHPAQLMSASDPVMSFTGKFERVPEMSFTGKFERVPEMFAAPSPVTAQQVKNAESVIGSDAPGDVQGAAEDILVRAASVDMFMDPAPGTVIPDGTVNGQPDPDRDRWRRYLIHGVSHTRATTFAKLGSNTKAIEQWGHRQVARGMTLRPDLLALADGLDVKRDRKALNDIVEQARDAAGQKVAANIGTAYHAFSERLDAGTMTIDQVPQKYRARLAEYLALREKAGLRTRPEWIERTTAVTAEMVGAPLPVAGTLDRIDEMPSEDLVVTDLKTGADLSYGEAEIEVQLAVYAHGVNTFGLFDWNTKQWGRLDRPVRTDFAIVVHLPAEGTGCKLIRVDIERGWREARLRGALQASQKVRNRFQTLSFDELRQAYGYAMPDPDHSEHPELDAALPHFERAESRERLAELYQYALDSGKFTEGELSVLAEAGAKRLEELPPF